MRSSSSAIFQKSQYSPRYYLNIGYYLRAFGDETHPKSWKCGIALRGHDLLGDETDLDELLDLEHPLDDDDRSVRLYVLLKELTPHINRGGTIDGLRAMLAPGSLPSSHLRVNAQVALLSSEG